MNTLNRTGIYQSAFAVALALTAGPVWAQSTTSPSGDVVMMKAFEVEELRDFADQAIIGTTPVSVSEIGKETIQKELGSRDIPMILNTTPSVFASGDSGGAGDARVNVRGFNQRNISVLINGVPSNDLENGWVYWSNWDGLGDSSSNIQMQRGLSNVTLPTPSVGGTMNILTDPASSAKGGIMKFEAGSDDFFKYGLTLNTGLLEDKFAVTGAIVVKRGDGYVRGTWTKGIAYYLGSTWIVNEKNRLELYAIGAPQQHGQRTFASNIAAYDAGYARSLGYTDADLAGALSNGPVDSGDAFNPNYAPVSSSYTGQQYYWGGLHSRHDDGYLNERENYFHKPQINLNWFSDISDTLKLSTVAYYSGGRGGGSGTLYNTATVYGFGSSSRAFAYYPNSDPLYGSAYNWDATIAANAGTTTVRGDRTKPAGQSLGILRNSVNNQDQYGVVSKLTMDFTDTLSGTVGVDWRTAEIDHFREIRDLLGGDYYIPASGQYSDFDTDAPMGLGDVVDYFNTNTVDWLGLFAQGQYTNGDLTAFGVYGYSSIEYGYTDHFRRASAGSSDEFSVNPGALDGHQIKGGVNYKFSGGFSAYVAGGWVSKVPNFDGVIDDITGTLIDPSNEKYTSGEVGVRWESADRKFNIAANIYFTEWRDRTLVDSGSDTNGDDYVVYLRGVDSDHSGVEIEAAYAPLDWLRFDFAAGLGDWTYTNDVAADARYVGSGLPASDSTVLYTKDLKVGDQPQTQLAYAVTFLPVDGLSIKVQGFWYDRYYSDFDPITRTDATDRGQVWEIPSVALYDLHINYSIPSFSKVFDVDVFAHVFNVFDEVYVRDATDNSSYEAVSSAPSHTAQRAEVFLGAPLTVNFGVKLKF